jgi:hypothetical protein
MPIYQLALPSEYVDGKTWKARKDICKVCPKKKLGLCTICKCVVHLKTRLKDEYCPDSPSKWPKV